MRTSNHRLLPCGDHALLSAEHFELAVNEWRQNPERPDYLAARQIVALALVAATDRASSTDPDKPGALAAATGGMDALARLLADFHDIAARKRK